MAGDRWQATGGISTFHMHQLFFEIAVRFANVALLPPLLPPPQLPPPLPPPPLLPPPLLLLLPLLCPALFSSVSSLPCPALFPSLFLFDFDKVFINTMYSIRRVQTKIFLKRIKGKFK
ncbi:MAG: hypothetical protein FWE54_04455 [Methanimicrococcus sp.]|nr:hypothetical protein [Methanimicrococcus sp.]